MHFTLEAFLKFVGDVAHSKVGPAVAAGGSNIGLDIEAGKDILSAFAEDFFSRTVPATVPDAPATTAAIQAHVNSAT